MSKFLNFIIHKFGGYTSAEYTDICYKNKESLMKYEAIKNAHDNTLQWFNPSLIYVNTKNERYNVIIGVSLRDEVPIEYLKRDLCQKISDKLFEDGLVSFDVSDNVERNERLYRGSISVMLPQGFEIGKI